MPRGWRIARAWYHADVLVDWSNKGEEERGEMASSYFKYFKDLENKFF